MKQVIKGIALLIGVAAMSGCGGSNGTNGTPAASATACATGSVSTMYGCQAVSPVCNNTAAFVNNQCVNGATITPIPTPPPPTCQAGFIGTQAYGCQQASPVCNNTAAWINNTCVGPTGVVATPPAPAQVITGPNTLITCQAGYLFTGIYGCQPQSTTAQCAQGGFTAFFNNQCIPAVAPTSAPTCQPGFLYVGSDGCQPAATATQCGNNMALDNGRCVTAIVSVQAAICTVGQIYTRFGCLPMAQNCGNQNSGFIAQTNTCYPPISKEMGRLNRDMGANGQYYNTNQNNGYPVGTTNGNGTISNSNGYPVGTTNGNGTITNGGNGYPANGTYPNGAYPAPMPAPNYYARPGVGIRF